MKLLAILLGISTISLHGCDEPKGPEDDLPTDGKLDSFVRPTEQGPISFGSPAVGILTNDARHLVWTFQLSGPASIHTFTSRVPHYKSIDTVLYLYKFDPSRGWGPYIARNDDDGRGEWSSLTRDLDAGEYRILVKGYAASTRGRFQVQVDCTGAGCEPPPSCVFGSTYWELPEQDHLVLGGRQKVTSPAGLSNLEKQRLILAVQQSSHTDVTTVEEAFARVDQNEFNVTGIYDPVGARSFTAVEYGVGDNSYGAIFYWNTTTIVSRIHDGDLEACTALRETCLLGNNYGELVHNPAFSATSSLVVTSASQLSGTAATQALTAIRVAYPSTDLADALTHIDQNRLNVITYLHTPTNTTVDAFEYGAGDNSYGAIFASNSLTLAAEIHDLDFYGCSLFE
ncbi:MAG: hypothetical protein ACTHU0_33755 [Kofleriaceae bacterium]